jgi:hypothetical protein
VNRINYLIGLSRADEIFINVLLPYLFIYYEIFGNKELSKKVLKVFNEYEQNSVNRLVKEVSDDLRLHRINSKAIYSQGVIELYRNLCSKNKCMECAIGQKVFN